MNYINNDYYNYILKIDNKTSPLHNTYQKILKVLLKEGLNNPINDEALKVFFQLFEIRRYELQESALEDLSELLYYDSSFRRAMKNNDNSYTIYPKLKELPTENDLLQYYCFGLKMNVKEIIDFLTPLINEKKSELKKSKIENYYGTPAYLLLRSKAIYDAVNLLNHRDDIEDKVLVNNTLSNVSSLLNTMLSTVGLEDSEETYSKLVDFQYEVEINKTQYDFIRECYLKILEQEDKLIDVSNKLWSSYALKNNGVFIHQLTQEMVESDKLKKICTSFYSDHTNVITNYRNANTGYAYPMDITNVFIVCEKDADSWQVTKKEYIERGLPDRWQLDETNLWYEYPYHSKLFPPEYIENQIRMNNSFAEIIIDNRKRDIKPLYCFYTSDATMEQIQKITDLAQKQGLEVKHILRKEEITMKK